MSLTHQQNIPNRPQPEAKPWTAKHLLSLKSTASELVKNFNALEVVLLFMVIASGVGELIGNHMSWGWYILLVLVLAANVYLRLNPQIETKSETPKQN